MRFGIWSRTIAAVRGRRRAAGMGAQEDAVTIDDRVPASRWPARLEIQTSPAVTYTTGPTAEGRRAWDADVAAFRASEHREPRAAGPVLTGTEGMAEPLPATGERLVMGYGSHWLFEVTDPPDYGFRVVNLVVDGVALVWELPGYNRADAQNIAHNFADGYL